MGQLVVLLPCSKKVFLQEVRIFSLCMCEIFVVTLASSHSPKALNWVCACMVIGPLCLCVSLWRTGNYAASQPMAARARHLPHCNPTWISEHRQWMDEKIVILLKNQQKATVLFEYFMHPLFKKQFFFHFWYISDSDNLFSLDAFQCKLCSRFMVATVQYCPW